MNFGLSQEQDLLGETVARFLEEWLPVARVREVIDADEGVDARTWQALAELGVIGCLVPEVHGGAELSVLDAAVIATALGHGAAPLPFLGSALLSTLVMRDAASDAVKAEWLPRLAGGSARMALAAAERTERRQEAGVRIEAGRLRGTALFVIDGAGADAYLVAVGDDVHLVPADADGLAAKPMPTIDRTRRVLELGFDAVAPADSFLDAGAALDRALDAGRVALSADIVGSCDRAIAMSVAYAMDRQQFGRPIATFQAVKHLCAEMAAAIEPARSLLWYAAHAWDAIPGESALTATLCKAHLSEVGHDLVRTATEVHGGIGFTDEHDIGLYLKRAMALSAQYGNEATHRARYARLVGIEATE